ncbi:ABC transporter substrate-binding protein [Pseudonocardia sp. NPDC049154]|uniref:ABC transporter substrate-binding protein n=1 Tax=Pseudonocardia sp. NPDC049154 TaxID=3155501 RepID=UPI0033C1FFAC
MSRLRPLSAVAALLTTSVLLLAGCSSGSGGGAADTATPDREATLRIAYAGPTQSLDPAKQGLTSSQPSTFLLYDRLTELGNDFVPKPMLAESWQPAPDGSYLELKLRRGATFHDGTPFDAAAVKANLERYKTLPGSTVAAVLTQVQGVDVVDPATVRLRLAPGTGASLPVVLASNAGEMISPKALADGRDLGSAPGDAGSGPYLVTGYRPNEMVTFERAPGTYWDPRAASPKRIEISYVAAASTRMNALRSGQIDVAHVTGADVPAAQKIADAGQAQATKVQTLVGRALYFRPGDPKFADVRVRQAISHAVDRQAISTQLLAGNATPLVQPYPPGHWANAPGLEDRMGHDPELAKRLLAEAGATGLSFQLAYTAGSPSFEPIAQVLQSQLAEAGITVTLQPVPGGEADAGFREGRFETALNSLNAVADPQQQLAITYLGGLKGGEAVRDQIAPLAAKADDPMLSQEQRGDIYRQIWTTVAEQASLVNLTGDQQIWLSSKKVTGVDAMPWTWAGNFDARYLGVGAAQ